MICARCDKPILPGEAYDSESIDGASAAGATVIVHREPCRRVDQPTVQQGRGVRRW